MFLPEGPYPCGPDRFSWVAIQHGVGATCGSINIFDCKTGINTTYELPGRPGFAFATDRGNFVVGCERALGLYHPTDGSWHPFQDGIDADTTGTIINDGVTWDGNLIFGTKDLEFKTKKAGLYLWRRSDRQLIRLRSDQVCSNGKFVVRGAGNCVDLYDLDTPTRRLVCYRIDVDAGTSDEGRVVIDLSDQIGFPDGMTVTPDGTSAIISLYNPDPAPTGRTIQIDLASGQVRQVWETPGSPQATCPQWVACKGFARLVITTAVEFMPEDRRSQAPNAGCLFFVDTDQPWDQDHFGRLTPLFLE